MKSEEVGLAAVSALRHCSAINDKVAALTLTLTLTLTSTLPCPYPYPYPYP